jgi:predicted ATPase
MAGRYDEALNMADEVISEVEANDNYYYFPELLRVKAEILFRKNADSARDAKACLEQSLEIARGQGALSWELRTAMSLTQLFREHRDDSTSLILSATYRKFAEGFETADLRRARHMLSRDS